MGTNYFMLTNQCGSCGRADELHIGKRSGGWRMILRDYTGDFDAPDDAPTSWPTWRAALLRADAIRDEYGDTHDAVAFVEDAETRSTLRRHEHDARPDGPVDLTTREFS